MKHYQISLDNPQRFILMTPSVIQVSGAELLEYPVTVKAKRVDLGHGREVLQFSIIDIANPEQNVSQSSSFFSPST